MKQIFYSHKGITIQAHHGFWKTVSCPHYPKSWKYTVLVEAHI